MSPWTRMFLPSLLQPVLACSAAAAAAKLLQSRPTLCEAAPSLGFSRQEHWSGLPFPSPMHESEKWKVKVKSLSRVRPSATPWTVAHQAPPSMGFATGQNLSPVGLLLLNFEKFKFFLGPGHSDLNTNISRNNEQAFLWGYWTLNRSIIVQCSSIFIQDGHSYWSLVVGGVSVLSVLFNKRDEVVCHLVDWKLI